MKPPFTRIHALITALLSGLLLLCGSTTKAQTNLAAGDIIFTGFSTANSSSSQDTFSFVLLTNITAGTQIGFSDRGYHSGSSWQGTGGTEGTVVWTSGTALPLGTEVSIHGLSASVYNPQTGLSAGNGTVVMTEGTSANGLSLSDFGDQIIAFQGGSGSISAGGAAMIAGVHFFNCNPNTSSASWDNVGSGCTASANSSTIPPGLTGGFSAFYAGQDATAGKYTCTGTPFTNAAQIRAAVMNLANWTFTGPGTYIGLPSKCTFISNLPGITSQPADATICANGTASFSITASGATSYQWQINTGSGFTNLNSDANFSGVTTATLTISNAPASMSGYAFRCVASNASGPVNSNGATLTVNSISATANHTDVSCNGGSNGTATVAASGGTGSYTYSWSPSGGTAANATGLTAGTYTVTITDANNCSTTESVTITEPTALTVTTSQTNVSCNGGSNGIATVTVSGGTGAYTYSWSPSGGTAATATGLAVGTYTVTITDANNCNTTESVTITEPTALTTTANHTNVSCNGGSNGTATVTVSGGTGAYTYSWSPSGGTAATATGLVVGIYTVTITDANNCSTTESVTITQPPALTTTANHTDVSCNGGSNGTAAVTATGGAGAYTYSWSPSGGTAATATGLAAGIYTVTITDANNCSTTESVTITQPPALTTTVNHTDVSCNGGSNGTATVAASGGTGAYTYSWSPSGGTAATANGLAVGTYTVTITDANNCSTTESVTITEPAALTTTTNHTNVSCNGGSNATATVAASGGTGSYTYSWSPSGGTAPNATGLTAGTYTVTITDANNCSTTESVTITEPAALLINMSPDASICQGAGTELSATVSGGTGGYSYDWEPGAYTTANVMVNPETTTTYTLTVTDGANCLASASTVVTVSPNLALSDAAELSTPGTQSSTLTELNAGQEDYYSGPCSLILSMEENPALGTVTASVTVESSLPLAGDRPYVARWYEIVTENNSPTTVIFYFKQSDFDMYNTTATTLGLPLLPQHPTDVNGIDSLVITKVSDGTLGTGTASLLVPQNVVWDPTANNWEVHFETASFSEFYIHANNAEGTPLPVTLSHFNVRRNGHAALLSWTTLEERNNKGFLIERSLDAKHFTQVHEVPGKANASHHEGTTHYSWQDDEPGIGTIYYRLIQVDLDGRKTYSDVQSIQFDKAYEISVYPNPAQASVYIAQHADHPGLTTIQLIDVHGRVVTQQELTLSKGWNKNSLSLSGLPQGMYQLTIRNGQGSTIHTVKIVLQ